MQAVIVRRVFARHKESEQTDKEASFMIMFFFLKKSEQTGFAFFVSASL